MVGLIERRSIQYAVNSVYNSSHTLLYLNMDSLLFPIKLCFLLVVAVYAQGTRNVALDKTASQSSNFNDSIWLAPTAVDGYVGNNAMASDSCFHTTEEYQPWWRVDLHKDYYITSVVIYNRLDCCAERARNIKLTIGKRLDSMSQAGYLDGGLTTHTFTVDPPLVGRFVQLQLKGITETFHLCEVEVMGYPLDQVSAAKIYYTQDLREGLPVNITCKVTGGMPPTEIAFLVNNIIIDQSLTHSHDGRTYMATLRFVKREWNGKYIGCQYNNFYFTGRSPERLLNISYPPSHILIEEIFSRPGKTVYKCKLIDSYPVCNIRWTADRNSFSFEETENKVDNLTRESWIEHNASRRMYRGTVQCTPQCQYFESKLNASQQIPFTPNITFNVARNQKISQESPKVVTCYAESSPVSNIKLIYVQNGEKKSVSCLKEVKCLITLEELNIRPGGRMNLECFATYTYRNVTESLTGQVTLYRDDADAQIDTIDQNQTSQKIIYRIVLAVLISVAVFALIIGLFFWYRQCKRLKQNAARESCPQANTNEDIAVEFANDEITYTQVHKTRARPEDSKMENQLVYIELDKDALEASIGQNNKKDADQQIEYVDINFTQKCQETDGEDVVYANQYGGHI